MRRSRRCGGAVTTLAAPAGVSPVGSPARADAVVALIATLPVKGRAPKTGYDHAVFGPAWTDDATVDGGHNGCDTRNDVAPAGRTPAPSTSPARAPTSPLVTSTGCHPLSRAGNCYRPGQTCAARDRGTSGIDASGERITCLPDGGMWRWARA